MEKDKEIIYHPMATARRMDGSIKQLAEYNGCDSKEEALNVIKAWADDFDFHLISAVIKVSNIGRPDLHSWIRVF